MAFRWTAILILVLALGIGYLATLNPDPVKIVLPFLGEFNPTSGLLMITSFFVGILCTLVFFAIRDWQEYFRKLASRKEEKLAQAAREKLMRARNYLQLGLRDTAVANLKEALERYPTLSEAHELMGDILAQQGDFYGAASSHNHAFSIDRGNDAAAWKLSRDYFAVGNTAMALKVFKDGLEYHDRNTYLLMRYRDFLMELKDWDTAISIQNRLSKIKEYRAHEDHRRVLAGIHFEKGKSLLAQQQAEEAVKAFEEATKLDPQLSLAYVKTGEAYLSLSKEKNALKTWALGYRRTLNPVILSSLEDFYLKNSDPSRIINLYLRYIEEKPQDVRLRLQFASLLYKLEMLQEAQNQIEEVRRIQGEDNPRVAFMAYQLKRKMDDAAGAMNELAAVVEKGLPQTKEQICDDCGGRFTAAADRCPACGHWGTLRPAV